MKKIKIYLGLLLVSVMSSCGDSFLTVIPNGDLSSETFWRNESDVEMALGACYSHFDSYFNIAYLDTGSDNGYNSNNFFYGKFANGKLSAAGTGNNNASTHGNWVDNFASSWSLYRKMRGFNDFLENVPDVDMDEDLKTQWMAEIRFLRAYDYFYKSQLFGDIQLVTKVLETAEESILPRDPVEDVEQFIISELEEIASDLPEYNMIDSNGHVTRGAAYALLSRLHLYRGEFAKAQAYAKKVIDMSCFELYPDYEEMFFETSEYTNKEYIFAIKYDQMNYPQRLTQLLPPTINGGYCSLDITYDFLEAFQMANGMYIDETGSGYDADLPFTNRDPRMEDMVLYPGRMYNGAMWDSLNQCYLNEDGSMSTNLNTDYYTQGNGSGGGMNLIKFANPSISSTMLNNYDADVPIFRLAEMYITYAECALETGDGQALALEYINKVRARSNMPAATTLDERLVRYERRIELAFEGLRYFDIKRWGLGAEIFSGNKIGLRRGSMDINGNITWTGDKDDVSSYCIYEAMVFYPERNYLLPIPQAVMDANPACVQNPGY